MATLIEINKTAALQQEPISEYTARIQNIIYYIFFILLIEGVLRKWILPDLSKPLFFLKDIFIIYLYILLAFKNRFPVNPWMSLSWIIAFALLILGTIQIISNELNPVVILYGWRNYVLYIPLVFIIEQYADSKLIARIGKLILWGAYPITILAFIQYLSSSDSFINKNVGTDNLAEVFTVGDGVVRPSSTFSFTAGFTLYISVLFIFIVYNFYLKKDKIQNNNYSLATLFALVTCIAVSGSRSSYASIGLQIAALVLSSFLMIKNKSSFKIIFYTGVGLFLALLSFNFIFERQRDLILRRQELAEGAEGSFLKRAGDMVISIDALSQSELSSVGDGLGLSSAGGSYLATGITQFSLSETEWGRVLLEAGTILGAIYIFFRIALTVNLFVQGLRTLSHTSNPTCIVAFAFISINLLIGPTTGNGMTYAFTWMFLGIALAMNRNLLTEKNQY